MNCRLQRLRSLAKLIPRCGLTYDLLLETGGRSSLMGLLATDIPYSKEVPYAGFLEADTTSPTSDSVSVTPVAIPF